MMTATLHERPANPPETTLLTPRFVAIAVAALAYFTGDGILIAAVPRYVAGPLGAGNVAVGLAVGAFSLSAFFLRPWVGGLGDRRGRKPLMLIGAGLFAVSVLGYGFASDPAALAALRLLTGAGEAFFFVGVVTAFTDLAPPERQGEAISLASLSLYVGIGAGPLLGELAIERFGFTAPAPDLPPSPWCSELPRRVHPRCWSATRARRSATASCTRRAWCRGWCSSRASSGWPASWPSCPCTRSTSG
jgi:MFS family permease